jgi:hypothetical protein
LGLCANQTTHREHVLQQAPPVLQQSRGCVGCWHVHACSYALQPTGERQAHCYALPQLLLLLWLCWWVHCMLLQRVVVLLQRVVVLLQRVVMQPELSSVGQPH